jgi:dipeptidyl aminopeptidase/acylaminoacyl peptidase
MQSALMSAGVETGLVVIEGAGHGFRTPEHRTQAMDALVAWFKEHLTER